MPTGGAGAGLSFTISDNTTGEQLGIIEDRTVGMEKRIPKFPTFMDRTRRFRRTMAGNSSRPGKLGKEPPYAFGISRNMWIKFGVGAFEVGVGHYPWSTVSRTRDEDRVQIIFFDQAIHVRVDEIQ